jgi:hypothetical protein
MDRQLSRNSTVFRQDPALRATFPGARKYPQITLQSGVLSGFPTALEPSLPRRLPPGTAPCTPLADRRAGQLPLPRDDIPPQHCCRHARSLPPPPGPDVVSSCPSSSLRGAL